MAQTDEYLGKLRSSERIHSIEESQTLFPRSDLCQQIKNEETDKSFYCYIPSPYQWMEKSYQVPYYRLETQFIADFYSYLMGIDYNRSDPCSFIKDHLPSANYLDSITSYLEAYPLIETLILFYQYHGDRLINNYLRSGLSSAINYLTQNKQNIISNIIQPLNFTRPGFQRILKAYGWSIDQFVRDLERRSEQLSLRYEPFIQRAAQDLQTFILKAPPTTNELITFRYIFNRDHLNLGQGEVTRLKGFTSTDLDHRLIGNHYKDFKMVFLIPTGFPVIPFIHKDSLENEREILLPHGTQVVHERTIMLSEDFDMIPQPQDLANYHPISNSNKNQSRRNIYTGQLQDIECYQSTRSYKEIYVFRVLHDPWEVQAALAYDPLNYNLYGVRLDYS